MVKSRRSASSSCDAEHVVAQDAAVLVALVLLFVGRDPAAEGRHLDRLRPAHHVHQPEAPPDDARAAENGAHLFGCGVGRDIEVLGLEVEQQVAHRAAHHERLVAGLLQPRGHPPRARADALALDAMLSRRGSTSGSRRVARRPESTRWMNRLIIKSGLSPGRG